MTDKGSKDMAEDKIEFELVAPNKLVLSEAVDMVVIPGAEGDFGVLVHHAPFISAIRPGVIQVHSRGTVEHSVFVAGGFAEVTPARCTVLAAQAMPVEDIDSQQVEQELKDAREDLEDAKDDHEKAAAARHVAVCEAKLEAARS